MDQNLDHEASGGARDAAQIARRCAIDAVLARLEEIRVLRGAGVDALESIWRQRLAPLDDALRPRGEMTMPTAPVASDIETRTPRQLERFCGPPSGPVDA